MAEGEEVPPISQRAPGKAGPVISRRNTRYCPESHEVIDREQCKNCEKFRYWPEGTKEEPRECWHDWQARPPAMSQDEDEE